MKKLDLFKKIEEAKKYQIRGKILEANKIFQELLKTNKDSFDLLYSYGLFCSNLKNFNLAKKVFLNLINKFPTSINSYILLAEIFRLENKFKDAEHILKKAIEIDPNHSDLLYNFSLLYFATRNFDYALTYINDAIRLSINNDVYKLLKSEIFINKNNFEEALKILKVLKNKRGIKDKNQEIRVDILMANAYTKKRDYQEAENILLKLIKKNKGFELTYLNLSILYREKNQLDKSIQILKKGINLSPNYMPFYTNLACFYRNSGQLKLAIETNLFIISKNKFDFNSFYELSGIYDFKNHKNELNFLLNLNLENLNPSSKIYAAFAISNLLHKQGKFKESAKNLKIANDESLKYKKSDSSLKIKHTKFYRSLKFKDSKYNHHFKDSSKYVFIVGMPRSGSTLLENILSLNPNVCDMGEVNFLEESIKEINDIKDVFYSYQKKVIHQFKSSAIYTDKNLFNYIYCPIISNFFPEAKIINCIRNPLDNILSIYRANFLNQPFSFSLQDISKLYINYFETMEDYRTKYSENIYDYYYEDLVENPSDVIPGIINWLDWDWNEKYLSPHKNKRNVFTASSAQIRKKFYSSSIGIWKEYKELLEPALEIIKTNKILRAKIY